MEVPATRQVLKNQVRLVFTWRYELRMKGRKALSIPHCLEYYISFLFPRWGMALSWKWKTPRVV